MNFLEALSSSLASKDEADGRIYGLVYGRVTSNTDPQAMGRVQALIGASTESSDWLNPCWPGGIESIPNVDDYIMVAFANGDPHRGCYFYTPRSTTKRRATEAMILGTTFVGMFNYLVTQFNQLRSDMDDHTHDVTGVSTGVGSVISGAKSTSAVDAVKGKMWDGSVAPNVSTSKCVLSDMAMVRSNVADAATDPKTTRVPQRFKKTS